MNDSTTTGIILAFAEIRGVAEMLAKHPDNETEKTVADHILKIIERTLPKAKPKPADGKLKRQLEFAERGRTRAVDEQVDLFDARFWQGYVTALEWAERELKPSDLQVE